MPAEVKPVILQLMTETWAVLEVTSIPIPPVPEPVNVSPFKMTRTLPLAVIVIAFPEACVISASTPTGAMMEMALLIVKAP